MNALKIIRGFGVDDPVPVAELDNFCYHGAAEGQVLDQDTEAAVFSPDRTVCCPMRNHGARPVRDCRACPHFSGMGEVKITGDADVNRRYRVVCSYPRPRSLALGDQSVKLQAGYSERLAAEIHARGASNQKLEMEIFVENIFSINCPIARATSGVWRVVAPACPMCEHYEGLETTEKGPKVLCAHRFGVQIQSTVMGYTLV